MKTNHLFTSVLALATIVVTSCSAPRVAQQNVGDDDVYNSNAQAKVYTPAPARNSNVITDVSQLSKSQIEELKRQDLLAQREEAKAKYENENYEESYYGTSDPYYDMDYSSRINRFYYSSSWRGYYDPYFYNNWYSPFSVGIGFSPYYGGGWNSSFNMGWGYLNSPYWGVNNWGWNNWGWNNYYGGGFYNNYYGGGYYGGIGYGGGGIYGGGYYTGRTTSTPNPRPYVGRDNGVGSNRTPRPSGTRSDVNGNPISGLADRADRYNGSVNNGRPARGTSNTQDGRTQTQSRPVRTTENNSPTRATERPTYTPPTRTSERPTYTPPTRTESSGSSSSGSSSGGGGARPTRGGRG
ncbi:hypothetical protein [Pedobacter metabolipauper]|uniref:Vitellogenin II n=1 Tax=Pedobacter metabolipauper TaxID=425513 RepID=A0A4R6T092_9SPHI|nr:hypothetical protein [Pedobacter metabolipauper]TDQ10978.1 hypothetical protein ATK78_0088 [Pedobacter metabolipauper]